MANSDEEQSADFLQDLNQRTSYLLDWRAPDLKTPSTPSRKLSLQKLRHDHVEQNKVGLRRQASKRYGLREWEGKQSLIHKVEYPLTNDDPDAAEEAFLMSKLLFHEAAPLPYAVITLKAHNNNNQQRSSNLAAQIAHTQREIAARREAELQKVVTCRTSFKPNGKLLPSITFKRSHPEKPILPPPPTKLEPPLPIKPARRLSLPNFQQQQNIIKLIQF